MASSNDTAAGTVDCASRTYSQLGLDADDALFGHFSNAMLECETLKALHELNPHGDSTSAKSSALAARILFPQQHRALALSSSNHDKRSPFRVSIAHSAIGPGAFNVDTPVPDHDSFANNTAAFEPGSSAWRVRTAFEDRTPAPASNDSAALDDVPQRAIRITIPAKTLFQCAWLDTWFWTVIMWILPAAIAILNYLASSSVLAASHSHPNLGFAIGFFACGLLLLALIFSRIETASLLRKLLLTFEAVYLIVWMLVYLVASIVQIPNEIALRTAKLGMDSDQYIFFCAATLFCVALCFVVVLCSDALIHVSAWFKIYVRCVSVAF
jgi:hypothetical protein